MSVYVPVAPAAAGEQPNGEQLLTLIGCVGCSHLAHYLYDTAACRQI